MTFTPTSDVNTAWTATINGPTKDLLIRATTDTLYSQDPYLQQLRQNICKHSIMLFLLKMNYSYRQQFFEFLKTFADFLIGRKPKFPMWLVFNNYLVNGIFYPEPPPPAPAPTDHFEKSFEKNNDFEDEKNFENESSGYPKEFFLLTDSFEYHELLESAKAALKIGGEEDDEKQKLSEFSSTISTMIPFPICSSMENDEFLKMSQRTPICSSFENETVFSHMHYRGYDIEGENHRNSKAHHGNFLENKIDLQRYEELEELQNFESAYNSYRNFSSFSNIIEEDEFENTYVGAQSYDDNVGFQKLETTDRNVRNAAFMNDKFQKPTSTKYKNSKGDLSKAQYNQYQGTEGYEISVQTQSDGIFDISNANKFDYENQRNSQSMVNQKYKSPADSERKAFRSTKIGRKKKETINTTDKVLKAQKKSRKLERENEKLMEKQMEDKYNNSNSQNQTRKMTEDKSKKPSSKLNFRKYLQESSNVPKMASIPQEENRNKNQESKTDFRKNRSNSFSSGDNKSPVFPAKKRRSLSVTVLNFIKKSKCSKTDKKEIFRNYSTDDSFIDSEDEYFQYQLKIVSEKPSERNKSLSIEDKNMSVERQNLLNDVQGLNIIESKSFLEEASPDANNKQVQNDNLTQLDQFTEHLIMQEVFEELLSVVERAPPIPKQKRASNPDNGVVRASWKDYIPEEEDEDTNSIDLMMNEFLEVVVKESSDLIETPIIEKKEDIPRIKVKEEKPVMKSKEEQSSVKVKEEKPAMKTKEEKTFVKVKEEKPVITIKDEKEKAFVKVKEEIPEIKKKEEEKPILKTKEDKALLKTKEEKPVIKIKEETLDDSFSVEEEEPIFEKDYDYDEQESMTEEEHFLTEDNFGEEENNLYTEDDQEEEDNALIQENDLANEDESFDTIGDEFKGDAPEIVDVKVKEDKPKLVSEKSTEGAGSRWKLLKTLKEKKIEEKQNEEKKKEQVIIFN